MLRRWKAWEAGDHVPDDYYRPLLARTFGTVTAAMFPDVHRGAETVVRATGMHTLDIISRLQRSDVDSATIEALRITVDRLCSEYPYMPSEQLLADGRRWLEQLVDMRSHRLSFGQHRELLALAGWLALLVGCVEFDTGDRRSADATRKAAYSLGREAGHDGVIAWSFELRAWMALTRADYRGAAAASAAGIEAAPDQGVTVQLAAQEARAYARMGDSHRAREALDRGRTLLEQLPHPENLDHHFAIDPAKFDFYAMDCHRMLGEDRIAGMYASEVIEASTRDGQNHHPMRVAEALLTLGVAAARDGEADGAVAHGTKALDAERKSLPSLLMASSDLANALRPHRSQPDVGDYLRRIRALARHESAQRT